MDSAENENQSTKHPSFNGQKKGWEEEYQKKVEEMDRLMQKQKEIMAN